MISSGTTAIATSGSGNVTLIDNSTPKTYFNYLNIQNTGTAAGFFSVDGGNNWGYIPASGSVVWRGRSQSSVLMKRASADMSGVFAFADCLDA